MQDRDPTLSDDHAQMKYNQYLLGLVNKTAFNSRDEAIIGHMENNARDHLKVRSKHKMYDVCPTCDWRTNTIFQVNVFYHDNNKEEIVEFKQYTIMQLISAAGGAMSLWLGMSFVAIFEAMEYSLRILMALCQRREVKN